MTDEGPDSGPLLSPARDDCASCGGALDRAGTSEHPYWFCPGCRVAVLNVRRRRR